ncbi:MAG: hypothetical protein LBS01_08310 [Prevotellaceae bacterium]|jgi:hypothetical protein|nr:hypothetical protein [Prevotellaceae bacterium]
MEKSMNLNAMGVMEMDAAEMRQTEGGNPIVIAILIGLALSAWDNVGDIREGWSDGINGRPPRH